MTQTPTPPAPPATAAAEEDDWLASATACSVEAGEDCEACQ
ncbi:hypothetical protein [Quadrisphaera sp. DSM 44207]|nr:hypothetical protein [Quadrisphaera sp. DSM 44207]